LSSWAASLIEIYFTAISFLEKVLLTLFYHNIKQYATLFCKLARFQHTKRRDFAADSACKQESFFLCRGASKTNRFQKCQSENKPSIFVVRRL